MTSTSPGLSRLSGLPDDLIGAIASYLSPNEIITLCQTCKVLSISDALKEALLSDPNAFRKAVLSDRPDIISSLLGRGVDPAFESNWAIRQACAAGHTEVVRLLLRCDGVDPTVDDNISLKSACARGRTDVVKMLLEREDVDPGSSENMAFVNACGSGHIDVVNALLADERIDPSAQRNKAFRCACMEHHDDVIRILMGSERVDLSEDGNRGLIDAYDYFNSGKMLGTIRLLSEDSRFDLSTDGNWLACRAVSDGRIDLLKFLLLDPRVDLDAAIRFDMNEAAQYGFDDIIQILLDDPRVDPHDYSDDMEAAMVVAIEHDQIETLKVFLADDRVCVPGQINAVMKMAFGWISKESLELLLNDDRFIPYDDEIISQAIKCGECENVECLLKDSRIDPSKNDNSAIKIAAGKANYKMTKILLEDRRVYETIDKYELLRIANGGAAKKYRQSVKSYFEERERQECKERQE